LGPNPPPAMGEPLVQVAGEGEGVRVGRTGRGGGLLEHGPTLALVFEPQQRSSRVVGQPGWLRADLRRSWSRDLWRRATVRNILLRVLLTAPRRDPSGVGGSR